MAFEGRDQGLGEGQVERAPGLGLRALDHQPPALARAHEMPAELERDKVPPPGLGRERDDVPPAAAGHRPPQRLRPDLGLCHRLAAERREIAARLQVRTLAVLPGLATLLGARPEQQPAGWEQLAPAPTPI
jgi:hypothetical protein